MSWVDAKTVFGHGLPEATDLATQQTEPALMMDALCFDDDVTAPNIAFDWEPTEVDTTPLR
jgi:hypothetical protein